MPAIAPTAAERAALDNLKNLMLTNERIGALIPQMRPDLSLTEQERIELVHITVDRLLEGLNITVGRDPRYIPFTISVTFNGLDVTLAESPEGRLVGGRALDEFTSKIKAIVRPPLEQFLATRGFSAKEKKYILARAAVLTSRACARVFAERVVTTANWRTIRIELTPQSAR